MKFTVDRLGEISTVVNSTVFTPSYLTVWPRLVIPVHFQWVVSISKLSLPMAGAGFCFFHCLFVCFFLSKTDAAKIAKLDIEMLHRHRHLCIYSAAITKGTTVHYSSQWKIQSQKSNITG